MSKLSDYRASIKRLIEAEDVEEAFKEEGFTETAAGLVGRSKSFKASRSVHAERNVITDESPHDKMSHGQKRR